MNLISQLSASQLQRADVCPASMVMPWVKSNTPNVAAERGNIIHKFLEDSINIGRDKALEAVQDSEYLHTCENINLNSILEDTNLIQTEIGYKYNILTDVCIKIENYRAVNPNEITYTSKQGTTLSPEITGITDLVLTNPSGDYTILDYKTGWIPVSVLNNIQLSFFAVCIKKLYNPKNITIGIVTVAEDGNLYVEKQKLNEEYLEKMLVRLKNIYANVVSTKIDVENNIKPSVVTGEHCKYCPAMQSCPAYNSLALAMSDAANMDTLFNINSLTIDQIGVVWERVKQAQKVIEDVQKSIRERATREQIPLPNGKMLRIQQVPKESIRVTVAEPILIEELGEELAGQVIEKTITKTKLQNTLKDKSKFDALVDKLRMKGAVDDSPYKKLSEVALKPSKTKSISS